jgi:YVTN family beta-propeller protein
MSQKVVGIAAATLVAATMAATAPAAAAGPTVYGYVVNYGSNNVSVIDTADNKVTTNISVGLWPLSAAESPGGKDVYVTNYGDCQSYKTENPGCQAGTDYGDSNLQIINTATNDVVKTVATGLGPSGLAVVPSGVVYVANFGANHGPKSTAPPNAPGTVTVYNPKVGKVTKTITVGHQPADAVAAKNGAYVYVSNVDDSTISVISTTTNTVVKTVKVADGVLAIAVSPVTGNLYVTSPASAHVSVLKPGAGGSLALLTTFSVGTGVTTYAITFAPNGKDAYVTSNNAKSQGYLTEVNTSNNEDNKIVRTASTAVRGNGALGARGVTVTPDGKQVYVTNYGVLVVPNQLDGSTFPKGNETVFTSGDVAQKALAVGQGPSWMATAP